MQTNEVVFRIPTSEYRSMPIPGGNGVGQRAKLATCFVRTDLIPDEFKGWMKVNPRIPRERKDGTLQGPVAKAMVRTLEEEPEKFAYKNQGIYLLVDHAEFKRDEGGEGIVTLRLSNPETHGLVNGGHTFLAIRQVAASDEAPKLDEAYVRLHIMEGINEDIITDLAEGLNRSMQVDNPSLENLRGTFEGIKEALEGKGGADQVAYRQGDVGEVDVQQILTFLAMLNVADYPDRRTHPNGLFGHPKAVLDNFVKNADEKPPVYDRMIPKVHEILVLADQIQQLGVTRLGKLKVTNTKKGNRVRSQKHQGRPAHFAGGTIDGAFPLGWLYPMVAAFRANIDREAWKKGEFRWLVNPKQLLEKVIDEMATIVKQEHTDNKEKPAEVGRKEAAYRMCYAAVMMELAQQGHLQ
jgi:hypothetical protein